MSTDLRGIRRGQCKACSCNGYSAIGKDSLKCTCGHAPGVHDNLTNPSSSSSTVVGMQHGYASFQPPATSYASRMVTGGPVGHGSGYSDHYYAQYTRQPSRLPKCKADDCSSEVFYDPEVGAFEYCGPECRDAYLLPKENEKLKSDLKELLEQLHAVRVAEGGSSGSRHTSDVDAPKPRTLGGNCESVNIPKPRGVDMGIITSSKEYSTEKATGLLVTGVSLSGAAFLWFSDRNMRLLDVIVRVNDRHYGRFLRDFNQEMIQCGDVTLSVNHSVALVRPKKIFAEAKKMTGPSATHIFSLRPPPSHSADDTDPFGFTCGKAANCCVESTTQGKVARESGLKFGDKLLLCATATKESVEEKLSFITKDKVADFLCKAAKKKKAIILVVSRSKKL